MLVGWLVGFSLQRINPFWVILRRIEFQTIQFSTSVVFVYTQLNGKTVLFQTIQLSMSTLSMSQTVQFQTIQFSISTQFSSIWTIDRSLSDATTQGLSGSWSDGIKGVLYIPYNSSITGTSLSDCFVSYTGHTWGGSFHSAEVQSMYSTTPANWAIYMCVCGCACVRVCVCACVWIGQVLVWG